MAVIRRTIASAPDPFAFGPILELGPDVQHLDGLTLANPAKVAALNPAVIVLFGGSMISNSVDSLYTPTNPTHLYTMVVHNGGLYQAPDPAVGTVWNAGKGAVGIALIDALVTAGYCTDAVIMQLGWNSSKIADWATGGQLHSRIAAGIRRLQAAGLAPTHIIYQGGSNDAAAGTTAAAYKASMADVTATTRAEGADCPFFINQQTWSAGTTNSTIRTAQADSAVGANVFLGFDSDTITSSGRQADNTHFNSTGRAAWVTGMLPFIQAH